MYIDIFFIARDKSVRNYKQKINITSNVSIH